MAAEKGNKYAEKWKAEDARALAEKALDAVSEDCFFISSIAEECGEYRELFTYLLKKFNNDEKVFHTLKRVYNKAESILWDKAAKGKVDKTVAIFALKSLHGLMETSKQEIDHTSNGDSISPIQWVNNDSD